MLVAYVCFQTMDVLIVNQSVMDMGASFFTLMTAVGEVDGTHMSRDRIQAGARYHVTCLVCHVTSTTTCLFVASGLQDSPPGGFFIHQPSTFFS